MYVWVFYAQVNMEEYFYSEWDISHFWAIFVLSTCGIFERCNVCTNLVEKPWKHVLFLLDSLEIKQVWNGIGSQIEMKHI
jgi:hypothetical protein